MRWQIAALTDRGRRRERNEDSYLARPGAGIYAVADGMGGHAAGDVASRLAIRVLGEMLLPQSVPWLDGADGVAARLVDAFAAANAAILRYAEEHPECGGMGTTLTALAPLASGQFVIGHVGDSRVYLVRDGELRQLTRDHTWVQQQVEAGMLTARAARHHRLSSVLNRVLGTATDIPADTVVMDAAAGDLFLLCTDGLTTMVEDADLHAMLVRPLSLEQHARDLVGAANLRGGADNITVVLLSVEAA